MSEVALLALPLEAEIEPPQALNVAAIALADGLVCLQLAGLREITMTAASAHRLAEALQYAAGSSFHRTFEPPKAEKARQ